MTTEGNLIRTVVTGLDWMHDGVESIESSLSDLIDNARREVLLVVYRFGTEPGQLLDRLRDRLAHGVRVKVVLDNLAGQPAEARLGLKRLLEEYPRQLALFDFVHEAERGALHAKAIIVDGRDALIGSANLSWHGRVVNYELAVRVVGPAAGELARTAEHLMRSSRVRRVIVVD